METRNPEMENGHEVRYLNGVRLLTKTCPQCRKEVLVLIHDFKDGKVVRTFCHLCPEPKAEGMDLIR